VSGLVYLQIPNKPWLLFDAQFIPPVGTLIQPHKHYHEESEFLEIIRHEWRLCEPSEEHDEGPHFEIRLYTNPVNSAKSN
jgi:hypothetical protein